MIHPLHMKYLSHIFETSITTKQNTHMKNASNVVTLNEFEAFALHKHYQERGDHYKQLGLTSIYEDCYEKANQWMEKAIEIANEAEAVKG